MNWQHLCIAAQPGLETLTEAQLDQLWEALDREVDRRNDDFRVKISVDTREAERRLCELQSAQIKTPSWWQKVKEFFRCKRKE